MDKQVEKGHCRPMGHIENYFAALNRQKLYKSFAFIMKFNHDVSESLLYRSLRNIILRYPVLATTIVNTRDYSDLSKPILPFDSIKVIDELKFGDVIYSLPDEFHKLPGTDEKLLYLSNIELGFGNGKPNWKIAVLDARTLALISNHCMADGINGVNLAKDLVEQFNELGTTEHPSESSPDDRYLLKYSDDCGKLPKLPPPIDSLVKYAPPLTYFPEYFVNTLAISKLAYRNANVSRSDQHVMRSFKLSHAQVQQVKVKIDGRCTLTPYIETAWLNAQYEFGLFDKSYLKLFDVIVPGNARAYLPDTADQDQFKYGANTSGIHKFHTPVREWSWSNIDYYNSFIKYCFKTKRFLYNMGILTMKQVYENTNIDKTVLECFLGQPRTNTMISNVGFVGRTAPGEDKFSLADISFAQTPHLLNSSFCLSVVSCELGGMNINVSMVEGALSADEFSQLVGLFKSKLLAVPDAR